MIAFFHYDVSTVETFLHPWSCACLWSLYCQNGAQVSSASPRGKIGKNQHLPLTQVWVPHQWAVETLMPKGKRLRQLIWRALKKFRVIIKIARLQHTRFGNTSGKSLERQRNRFKASNRIFRPPRQRWRSRSSRRWTNNLQDQRCDSIKRRQRMVKSSALQNCLRHRR